MYSIIIDCSGFTLGHNALIVDADNNVIHSDLIHHDNVIDYAMGVEWPISSIKIAGPGSFCYALKEEIETKLATEYANNKITVEVI